MFRPILTIIRFSSERCVCCKSVYIKHALYKHSYSMTNVGRNTWFLSYSNKHKLDMYCCVIGCNYTTYYMIPCRVVMGYC